MTLGREFYAPLSRPVQTELGWRSHGTIAAGFAAVGIDFAASARDWCTTVRGASGVSGHRRDWAAEQTPRRPARVAPAAMSASDREYSDSDDSYLESSPLYGHPRYAPVRTLSSGPAGSLQVGLS